MKVHALKTIQPYYNDVWRGDKTFEVRYDDRGFQVGDLLKLEEYDPKTKRRGVARQAGDVPPRHGGARRPCARRA